MPAIKFSFNPEKALEAILYVASKTPIKDIYHVLKIIYFADLKHLERYGRFIFGDIYFALPDGPVPSKAYDIIKYVRDGSKLIELPSAKDAFEIYFNHNFALLRAPNVEMLSISDIRCLDESILENGALSYETLRNKSHDLLHNDTKKNSIISVERIASTLRDGDIIIDYLRN